MKNSSYKIIKIFLFLYACSSLIFSISKPYISISQHVVTPRINLFNDPNYDYSTLPGLDEPVHYRTQVDINYPISKNIRLSCVTEYGTQNFRNDQEFRVHSLITDIDLKSYSLSLGRQFLRNPFYFTHLDGVKVEKIHIFGSEFSLSGGVIPEFYKDPDKEKSIIQVAGRFSYDKGMSTISVWDIKEGAENSSKAGMINRHKISDQLNLTTYFSWDLKENVPYYNKLHLQFKKNRSSSVYLGVRQRIFNIEDIYPWIPKDNWVVKSVYSGGYHQFSENLLVKLRYSVRFADQKGSQLQSSVQMKNYNLTLIHGDVNGDKLIGGSLSTHYKLNSRISFGGNVALNSLDVLDETELKESTSIYGWSEFRLFDKLKIRIFGQYSENSYYTQDGRGGLYLTYAI